MSQISENYSAKDLSKNNINFGVFTKIEVSLSFEKVLINLDMACTPI